MAHAWVRPRAAWILCGVVLACRAPEAAAPRPPTALAAGSPEGHESSPPASSVPATVVESPPRRAKAKPRSGPPRIKSARLIDPKTLELVFTEALAPTDALDPNAFRLSLGMSYRYVRYAYAYYYDLGEAFSDKVGNFVGLHRRADDKLQLVLEADLDPELCPELVEIRREIRLEPGVRGDANVYLHYAPPASGGVVDTQGQALAPIGDAFARDRQTLEREFEGKAARKVLGRLHPVRCDI